MSTNQINELRAEIKRLNGRLDAVEGRDAEPASPTSVGDADHSVPSVRMSRRNWVRTAAGAAVGGTAVALAAGTPVAADDPNDITLGARKDTASRTQADYTGGGGGAAFVFQAGDTRDGALSATGSALAGWTTSASESTGVHGLTEVDDGRAIGVLGAATGTGTGVTGRSTDGNGLSGDGGTYGLRASGALAAVKITPSSRDFPQDSTEMHLGGEIYARAASDSGLAIELWFCTVGGTPGTWVQVAGPALPGTFRALDPVRVYDSRIAASGSGRLGGGSNRTVDVSSARDLITGAVIGGAVPEGAGAIAFNLGAVNTTDSGFFSVTPSSATEFRAASINWYEDGQIINNGTVVRLGNDRKVKVFAGGSGSAHLIIDITGYWI